MITIKGLVNNKEWQKLRQSLVGTWSEHAEENVSKLRSYLGGDVRRTTEDKLRIVMNYLTGSGFRSGRIKSVGISRLRADISAEMQRRKFK